jgi:hypothetical protein
MLTVCAVAQYEVSKKDKNNNLMLKRFLIVIRMIIKTCICVLYHTNILLLENVTGRSLFYFQKAYFVVFNALHLPKSKRLEKVTGVFHLFLKIK